MSGHSKWSTIKRKKAALDSKRGKLWTKLLKEITVASRLGGGDPSGNPRLRSAMAEARGSNVPSDNIDRAIKKGTGELEGASYEEITLEGYGPGGVAMLVEGITDNRNRTVAEVRHLFSKHGGNLGENGCVAYLFERRGLLAGELGALSEDDLMEVALEAGADDYSCEDGMFEMFSAPNELETVREQLEAKGVKLEEARLAMIPTTTAAVEADRADQVLRLADALEDNEDVQNVWSNADLSALPAEA